MYMYNIFIWYFIWFNVFYILFLYDLGGKDLWILKRVIKREFKRYKLRFEKLYFFGVFFLLNG